VSFIFRKILYRETRKISRTLLTFLRPMLEYTAQYNLPVRNPRIMEVPYAVVDTVMSHNKQYYRIMVLEYVVTEQS
jgi:hypothetical protein